MTDLPDGWMDTQEERIIAALDLLGRTGARSTTFGYLHDNVPLDEADWWADAHYRGSRQFIEHAESPAEALERLCRKLVNGGQCVHCRRTTTMNGRRTSDHNLCVLTRRGNRWNLGCEKETADG